MNADDLQYLERHLADAGRVELRALYPAGTIISGQFDKAPPLVDAIHNLRQRANLYYTAQAPALRAVGNRMGTGALGNSDIASFTRIVFDLDTVREPGQAATDSQLESASGLVDDLTRFLYREDWPAPVAIFSGNAGRIMRCPGSYNLKVPTCARLCEVESYPRRWHQVQPRHIETVARVLGQFEAVPQVQAQKKHSQDFHGSGN